MKGKNDDPNPRRQFISTIASGAATLGLSTIISPLRIHAENKFFHGEENPEQWFNQIKGKHRIVFDVPGPNEIFPFAWPRIFLVTNGATGTSEKDWLSGILPGIKVVPAGIWALNRAQEKGCSYCYAG